MVDCAKDTRSAHLSYSISIELMRNLKILTSEHEFAALYVLVQKRELQLYHMTPWLARQSSPMESHLV